MTFSKPINKIFSWLTAFGAILFLILGISDLVSPKKLIVVNRELNRPNFFNNLRLEAQAVLVYDLNSNRELFSREAGTPLPIASLTKVMTTLAAKRILKPETSITFSGHDWRPQELFDYTLIASSNAAATAIAMSAEKVSGRPLVDEMNLLAQELGLTQTHFENPTGLDSLNGQSLNTSTAYELVRLFTYALREAPDLFAITTLPSAEVTALDGVRYELYNTNTVVREIPGLLASKTGFTDQAQGSLGVVFDRGLNQPTVVIILGSSEEGRFNDLRKIITAVFQS